MAGEFILFVDTVNKKLVKSSTNAADFIFPSLIQGETLTLNIYFLDPTNGTPSAPYDVLTFSGATMKVGLCGGTGLPTGTASDPTPTVIAFQDTFSTLSNPAGFSGTFSLNTTDVADFLGALNEKLSTFEIELTPSGGTPKKYLQKLVSLKAAVIESGSAIPTLVSDYATRNELLAGWVKKIEDAGNTITLISPNGLYGRIIGVRNDGSAQDDIIAL